MSNDQSTESLGTIYLIDDEVDILEVEKDLLESHNYKVKEFTDYHVLLKAIQAEPPHLIVSDMKMPDIDGLVLQTEINKTHPGIPIVFVSGFLTKDVVIKAIQHGAFSVVEKPFRYEQVIQTCAQAVKHSLALRKLEKTVRNLEQIVEKYKIEGLKSDFQEVIQSFSTQVNDVVLATFELKNEK